MGHSQYVSVEPERSRWHVSCESITTSSTEIFTIISPHQFLCAGPVRTDDMLFLRSGLGHFLGVLKFSLEEYLLLCLG